MTTCTDNSITFSQAVQAAFEWHRGPRQAKQVSPPPVKAISASGNKNQACVVLKVWKKLESQELLEDFVYMPKNTGYWEGLVIHRCMPISIEESVLRSWTSDPQL